MPTPTTRHLVRRKLSSLKLDQNVRHDLGPEAAARPLWRSRKKHQVCPFVIKADGTLIDGYRSYWGAELEGDLECEVDCLVVEGDPTPEEVARLQILSAIHRADISPYDKAAFVQAEAAKGKPNGQIAAEMDLSGGFITQLRSLFTCIPAVVEAAKAGQVGPDGWYDISKFPHAEQADKLQLVLSGRRKEVREQNRQRKKGDKPSATVKTTAIKLPLREGVSLLLKGPGLSLDDAIALAELAAEKVKQARQDGHTAKTIRAWVENKPPKKPRKPRGVKA